MRIDILTLFPDAVDAMMHASILGRAQERGYITIRTHQIRSFTTNKQMQVDDYPYGGGRGAVMQADPLYRCWAHVCEEAGSRGHTIYLSPCGRTFTQNVARELKETYDHLILVCGRTSLRGLRSRRAAPRWPSPSCRSRSRRSGPLFRFCIPCTDRLFRSTNVIKKNNKKM